MSNGIRCGVVSLVISSRGGGWGGGGGGGGGSVLISNVEQCTRLRSPSCCRC